MAAIAASNAKPVVQTVPNEVLNLLPFSPWGADNNLPVQYIADIEKMRCAKFHH